MAAALARARIGTGGASSSSNEMIRRLTGLLNATSSIRRVVSTRFPEETIKLCTAATILDAPSEEPIGWSLRRFVQRRGNVVITDRRVFVQSSFRSPFTVLWTAVLALAVYRLVSDATWAWTIAALSAGILVFQRRPYCQDLPFAESKGIRFGSVRGVSGRGDILAVSKGDRALHLVTSEVVSDELKRNLEARINLRSTKNGRK